MKIPGPVGPRPRTRVEKWSKGSVEKDTNDKVRDAMLKAREEAVEARRRAPKKPPATHMSELTLGTVFGSDPGSPLPDPTTDAK